MTTRSKSQEEKDLHIHALGKHREGVGSCHLRRESRKEKASKKGVSVSTAVSLSSCSGGVLLIALSRSYYRKARDRSWMGRDGQTRTYMARMILQTARGGVSLGSLS